MSQFIVAALGTALASWLNEMTAHRPNEESMWQLANDLASSGAYIGWLQIECELRSRGYLHTRAMLDNNPVVRECLDRQCAGARKDSPPNA